MPSIRLSDATEEYLKFRKTSQERATWLNDRLALTKMQEAVGNFYVHNLTREHMDKFIVYARETCGSNTVKVLINSLSSFFKWARLRRLMKQDQNPLAGIKITRVEREHVYIPPDRFPALLDAAGSRHPRDRALVAMLLYTLKRRGEVCSTRIADVDLGRATIHMYNQKLKRPMQAPVPAVLDQELRRWLTFYTAKAGTLQPDWYLIPAKQPPRARYASGKWVRHNNLTAKLSPTKSCYRSVSDIMRSALEDIGVATYDSEGKPLWIGGHTARRSGGDALVSASKNIRLATAAYDHKSQQTTELYLRRDHDHEALRNYLAGNTMYPVDDVVLGGVTSIEEERRRRGAAEQG